MSTIKILVTPMVVKNKPETDRDYTVLAEAKGWVKQAKNDGKEILTESEGLDVLLADCNLDIDGETKIDASKPIGKEVTIEIYNPDAVAVASVTVSPATKSAAVGSGDQTFTAAVLPANATYPAVEWSSSDETVAKSLGGGKFSLLKAGTATISAISIDGGVTGTAALTVTA